MSGVMTWLSRLESTTNKHRLTAGKGARTVNARAVLDEVLRTHRQEALSHDAPSLLSQAIAQLLEGDWRAQPKREASWQTYWRGLRLPSAFVYEGAVAPVKTTPDIAWHPWLAERVTGPITPQVKERLLQLNKYLFRQTELGKPLFPGTLGHRERSLLLFGDEKALDSMPPNGWKHVSLTLADMGATRRAPPLPYTSSGRRDLPAIIVENSDVYYRLCQLNRDQPRWSLVIYGAGNKVSGQAECVSQLLKAEQVAQLLYFGDLDVAGLKIAHQLRRKLLDDYGISLQLDEWLYDELIRNRLVTPEGNANNERFDIESRCDWMPRFVVRAMKTLMAAHLRLPQEGVANR
ncbi:Wadjet anti-phage system protein JetD domain-containing protein [Oceanimonas marisflavi]|uniref:Wadjet anti-phage system protein JetD domain-containing protein n=1 Tax=Oceanimonas marisflavi TaxID=2059724 RepID=UPI0018E5976A|nr:Wadjet anti-phage system protein JetD domain-containing protein [Oceanimonas marisflavi]